MLTYICKYTPVELLLAFGIHPYMPNDDTADLAGTDSLIHSSVCSHAKMLLASLMNRDAGESASSEDPHPSNFREPFHGNKQELLLTNCCDSIRRVYDTISPDQFSFRTMLDLPHKPDSISVERYTGELLHFAEAYGQHCGQSFDRQVLIRSWKKNADAWREWDGKKENESKFVAVLGARPSDELLQKIRDTLSCPIIDLSCGGFRSIQEPPEDLAVNILGSMATAECPYGQKNRCGDSRQNIITDEELFHAYAEALLSQIPCMRMSDVSRRSKFLSHPGLAGIIYHSVRFCDYYSFEYADIRRETDLPVLKIESDYTSQSEGQLATRLEAFRESLNSLYHFDQPWGSDPSIHTIKKDISIRTDEGSRSMHTDKEDKAVHPDIPDNSNMNKREISGNHSGKVYIGIDSGSTTTNGAAIDENGKLLASCIVRTGARAGDAAQRVLDELKKGLSRTFSPAAASQSNAEPPLPSASSPSFRIQRIVATGYGRDHINFADDVRTEISCHARGAHHVHPEARTIIDIGGQDSKVICIDEMGDVTNFVMNDKCAAGTGKFLEMMAHTLELDLDEMSEMGLSWKKDLTITSTCTVFAESEVVSLVAENSDTADIIHALDKSVARKTVSMVRRVHGVGPYMMTGGVARNRGVARELERDLGSPLFISEDPDPDLIGAIGAALYAGELS